MESAFTILVHTGEDYSPPDYGAAAKTLEGLLRKVLEQGASLFNKSKPTRVECELEIGMEPVAEIGEWGQVPYEMTAHAIVRALGPAKTDLVKSSLTKALKAHELNAWGSALKVEKRSVQVDSPSTQDKPFPGTGEQPESVVSESLETLSA